MDIREAADIARLADGVDDAARDEAQRLIVAAFELAGVGDEASLAAASAVVIAERTGIALVDVEWFQAAAREAIDRVVLAERVETALLFVSGESSRLPIVTARAKEDVFALMGKTKGDAVILQEGDAFARARLAGALHEGLPIFRDDGEGKLTRVRVKGVRAKQEEKKANESVFGRFKRPS